MSLLEKARTYLAMSQELLYAGDNAGSLACALEAAKYLQLIKLLRQDVSTSDFETPYGYEDWEQTRNF